MASPHDSVLVEERAVTGGSASARHNFSNGLAALFVALAGVIALSLSALALHTLLLLTGIVNAHSRMLGLLALMPMLALVDVWGVVADIVAAHAGPAT